MTGSEELRTSVSAKSVDPIPHIFAITASVVKGTLARFIMETVSSADW